MAKKKIEVTMDSRFATAVVLVVMGVLLLQLKSGAFNVITSVVGALLVLRALLYFVDEDWIKGCVYAGFGVFLIIGGMLIIKIMIIVFGVVVAAYGLYQLIIALKDKKGAPALIAAIVTIVAGALLIVTYWYMEEWFFITLGVVSIVAGVFSLFGKKIGA